MEGKWLYDIFLDDRFIGDQGDGEFDTVDDAVNDANDYIEFLAREYERNESEFDVSVYQAIV